MVFNHFQWESAAWGIVLKGRRWLDVIVIHIKTRGALTGIMIGGRVCISLCAHFESQLLFYWVSKSNSIEWWYNIQPRFLWFFSLSVLQESNSEWLHSYKHKNILNLYSIEPRSKKDFEITATNDNHCQVICWSFCWFKCFRKWQNMLIIVYQSPGYILKCLVSSKNQRHSVYRDRKISKLENVHIQEAEIWELWTDSSVVKYRKELEVNLKMNQSFVWLIETEL